MGASLGIYFRKYSKEDWRKTGSSLITKLLHILRKPEENRETLDELSRLTKLSNAKLDEEIIQINREIEKLSSEIEPIKTKPKIKSVRLDELAIEINRVYQLALDNIRFIEEELNKIVPTSAYSYSKKPLGPPL